MSFTVVPLHNLSLPLGTRIPFGADFTLQEIPPWVKDVAGGAESGLVSPAGANAR